MENDIKNIHDVYILLKSTFYNIFDSLNKMQNCTTVIKISQGYEMINSQKCNPQINSKIPGKYRVCDGIIEDGLYEIWENSE